MKLHPYTWPLQRDYVGAAFRPRWRRFRPLVESLLARDARFRREAGSVWIRHHPGRDQGAPDARRWIYKVYVCVRARHYGPLVLSFVGDRELSRYPWKFYFHDQDLDRPDKIVFHTRTRDGLAQLVARLRARLGGRATHGLAHCASTVELGLEEGGAGLYVGMDPTFLGTSWRLYRTYCRAWMEINHEYLESLADGRAGWMRRMNLSSAHEGPATLNPELTDVAYVRRHWRWIVAPR